MSTESSRLPNHSACFFLSLNGRGDVPPRRSGCGRQWDKRYSVWAQQHRARLLVRAAWGASCPPTEQNQRHRVRERQRSPPGGIGENKNIKKLDPIPLSFMVCGTDLSSCKLNGDVLNWVSTEWLCYIFHQSLGYVLSCRINTCLFWDTKGWLTQLPGCTWINLLHSVMRYIWYP